jgi:hypothetical protein
MLLPTPAKIKPLPRRTDAFMIPRAVEGAPGQFLVDATWGTIMPMQLAPEVRTVGELAPSPTSRPDCP